ncbi:putative HTH-type transcriptional regulator YdcR [Halomonas elongata]|uniref:Putative HTH-type transcriptional regulator YdcR n=1 Tax=Halomonas elongata TaxID=2746 RepID=A0A1B8P6J2_HALEL|nr:PLP-dependent aminotransferase family protein [Halomonas elongata]OBX37886.1 putative HTH-type transcriptional regulator YdcR [Halomonas elongata]
MKRYERFADEIAELIRNGVLAPGGRIPSVRQASRQYGISPSTVFQAYYLLEDRGLIVARSRSGYYVREQAQRVLHEPRMTPSRQEASDVSVSELAFSVLDSLQDTATVPFGSAFPSPDLFPLARLARSMAKGLRGMSGDDVLKDMTAGDADLRRQIVLRYTLKGMPLPPDELVITSGAMEALNLGLQCVTSPGDLVAIESPAFYASLQILERLKLRAVEIPVHPCEGRTGGQSRPGEKARALHLDQASPGAADRG